MDNHQLVVKEENWFYCLECKQKSYLFECCNNSYCNGSGCDECAALWEVIHGIFQNELDPNSDEFKSRNNEY